MSEAQVAEEMDRIRKAAVRNHTPEVYKLCYSAVDLTTLSCTDSVESVTEFAGKAVKFYRQFPHLPNVASICIYPPFVETVGVVVDGTDMRITSVAGGFPSSQTPPSAAAAAFPAATPPKWNRRIGQAGATAAITWPR